MSIVLKTDKKQLEISLNENESNKLFDYLAVKIFQSSSRVLKGEAVEFKQDGKDEPESKFMIPGYGYNGFLAIKCKSCGKIRAFCIKDRIKNHICSECGEITDFDKLFKKMYVNCECGKKAFYMTNITDEMADISCVSCGSPVPVRYNSKKDIYETIR